MASVGEVLALLLVGALWGGTNPLLRRGAEGLEAVPGERGLLAEMRFLGCNRKALLPLALNQAGSLVFFLALAGTDLTLAVPLCNSLALMFTVATGKILGEDLGGARAVLGLLLTGLGIALCIAGSGTEKP